MSKEYTYNDRMNQLARHQMLSEVQKTIMGSDPMIHSVISSFLNGVLV
jgi:hypothetical protein